MISIRTIPFEYKTISSYYDNYIHHHKYDLIKGIVAGIENATDDETKRIRMMHQLLLLCDSSDVYTYSELRSHFVYLTECILSPEDEQYIKQTYEGFTINPAKSIASLLYFATEVSFWESYFCFILATLLVKRQYKEYIVMPLHIVSDLLEIENLEMRIAYFDGYIRRYVKHIHNKDTKTTICNLYESDKEYFIQNGFENIYLFGSIAKGIDSQYSDIDLVVKLHSGKNIKRSFDLLREYNKRNFDRNSDIHLHEKFIVSNPQIDLLPLI